MKHFFKISVLTAFILVCFISTALTQPNFTAYTAGNPVIPKGLAGTWDQHAVWWASATVVNDTFYLLYNGSNNFPTQPPDIGLAVSSDGYNFTKDVNPVLTEDGTGFDAYSASDGVLYYDNSTWYLYYDGLSTGPSQPGNVIGRATASNPHGSWIRSNDTLLTVGNNGEWDDEFIIPLNILRTDTGLVLYYMGGDTWPFYIGQIGIATSTDNGLSWTKHIGNPVLSPGPGNYDILAIIGGSIIKKSSTEWEMVYGGENADSVSICYATSSNGISWNKFGPVLTPSQDPLAITNLLFQKPVLVIKDSNYYMYYDYGVLTNGIGMATAPAPPNTIEKLSNQLPSGFNLSQNYPNPFNPQTTIEFSIAKTKFVTLKIYNILGRELATLVSEKLIPGNYKYNWNAPDFASGVYMYKIEAGNFVQTRKLILMK